MVFIFGEKEILNRALGRVHPRERLDEHGQFLKPTLKQLLDKSAFQRGHVVPSDDVVGLLALDL